MVYGYQISTATLRSCHEFSVQCSIPCFLLTCSWSWELCFLNGLSSIMNYSQGMQLSDFTQGFITVEFREFHILSTLSIHQHLQSKMAVFMLMSHPQQLLEISHHHIDSPHKSGSLFMTVFWMISYMFLVYIQMYGRIREPLDLSYLLCVIDSFGL